MAKLRLQGITASTPARILLTGLLVTGTTPTHPRLRLTAVMVSGTPAILTDVYAYTGSEWQPTPPVSWDGSGWG